MDILPVAESEEERAVNVQYFYLQAYQGKENPISPVNAKAMRPNAESQAYIDAFNAGCADRDAKKPPRYKAELPDKPPTHTRFATQFLKYLGIAEFAIMLQGDAHDKHMLVVPHESDQPIELTKEKIDAGARPSHTIQVLGIERHFPSETDRLSPCL